jgi:hypothetical protein
MAEASVPKKRNRNRLKEFYGIKKEDNVDKTTDINSDQFHSDVYMKVSDSQVNKSFAQLMVKTTDQWSSP